MNYVVSATWIARADVEPEVAAALRELAAHTRMEPGNLAYIPYHDPADPTRFGIFEVYTDENAFAAHLDSPHFHQFAVGRALPLLDHRGRETFRTLIALPEHRK
ncbi:putative quinol monooxygenase [Kutzneria sp. CA-103260]|uniref:putative quinol monooxygenase n=1 Tax=Kutzneria sp. CA-103260 TaxID=2802641 RepID=UPI001BA62AEB|nr:putative quinol monooxygenase [Kutzneria sp. CA-103260]QUQ64333.1 antibiotic biosynthesis monooxygenase [Kutzneria sp. CA-103260]